MAFTNSILVVDDEPDNRTLVRRLLEFNGYQVLEARNGVEALEMVYAYQPQLVLLDLSMPHLDGWQTARCLRADPAIARLPIVAISANAMRGDQAKALAAGCNDYVVKPLDMGLLLERVRAFMN